MDVSKKLGNEIIENLRKNKDIGALITIVEKTNNPSDGRFAIWALGELKAEAAVEPLSYALLSNSYRQASITALGNIGNEKAVTPLYYLIRNHDEPGRKDILESLGKIASKEAINIIIEMLVYDDTSEKAISVLKKLDNLAVGPLINNLETGIREKVILALGEVGDNAKAATEPLLKILEATGEKDDPNCTLRGLVLNALALIKDPDAVEPLINTIKYNTYDTRQGDFDYVVQIKIIITLGDIGHKLAIEPLIRIMLSVDDIRMKGTAAAALGKIGDNQAVEPLVKVLENTKENEWVRDNAAWALLQMDEGKTSLPLMNYLKGKYKNIFESFKGVKFPSEIHNNCSEEQIHTMES